MIDRQADDLAGTLRIAPGQPRPHNLLNSRRDWAALLTRGLPASTLADRLATMYSLCGESHRLCARMALAAAQANTAFDMTGALPTLQRETLREHVRRITLDWPRQLVAGHPELTQQAHALLRQCPVLTSAASSLEDWWLEQVLGVPAAIWLAQWEANPAAWLRSWSERTALCVPQMLHRAQPLMDQAGPSSAHLCVHDSTADLRALALDLERDPAFTRQPVWRGHCAETGTWSRLHQTQSERFNTTWLRLGARLAELVRLALPDEPGRCGAQWLSMGRLPIAPQCGLAWVEMARGLLIHHVQLDVSETTVMACHVVAPTEWNFHPQGAVAQVIESIDADISSNAHQQINALMSAYDPCVTYEFTQWPVSPRREPCNA